MLFNGNKTKGRKKSNRESRKEQSKGNKKDTYRQERYNDQKNIYRKMTDMDPAKTGARSGAPVE